MHAVPVGLSLQLNVVHVSLRALEVAWHSGHHHLKVSDTAYMQAMPCKLALTLCALQSVSALRGSL
jgi:hypothetical protein